MNPTLIIGGALALLLAVSSGFGAWQYNRANGLQENLAKSEASREADQKTAAAVNARNLQTIADMRERAAESQAQLDEYSARVRDITAANLALRNDYDKWRGRLDQESQNRPEVVARAARASIRRFMLRVQRGTDPDNRQHDGSPAAADPAPPAKGGSPAGAGAGDGDAQHDGAVERGSRGP